MFCHRAELHLMLCVHIIMCLRVTALQVVFLSMLGRSTADEMARITERGAQHAAAGWLCIANHALQAEEQLHAHQQV